MVIDHWYSYNAVFYEMLGTYMYSKGQTLEAPHQYRFQSAVKLEKPSTALGKAAVRKDAKSFADVFGGVFQKSVIVQGDVGLARESSKNRMLQSIERGSRVIRDGRSECLRVQAPGGPEALEKVPLEHGIGTAVPEGQTESGGQIVG